MRLLGFPVDLWRITGADFIVRTTYQMGKTPLLPLYAAALGASDLMIGQVVAISTLTGLLLKPLFGLLSDRSGRRVWLLVSLGLFAFTPFLYRFVETPEQLFALRLFHGTATAIFGPVGLAYVAEMGTERRAERLGLFGMARIGGSLLAPIIAALLLIRFPPEQVFTIIGFASCLAFLPVIGMADKPMATRQHFGTDLAEAVRAVMASRAFRLVAALEMAVYIATYAIKAFLPIYALKAAGFDLLEVGVFFSAQELVHLLTRPFGGRLADRLGCEAPIMAGFLVLAASLMALGHVESGFLLVMVAAGIGVGLGLILPATLSLFSTEMPAANLGAGMGALGALRNLGKVVGPVAAGVILAHASYSMLFSLCALFILATVSAFAAITLYRRRLA
ncbi:MAG TPA: MFS transporter [Thermohalobaculum sp.]|nr:MFS transporter [Thermohalobaculum sp.]